MGKFTAGDDEKIHLEGRATYLKSAINVVGGYAFFTSKRLVFAGANSALQNAFSGTPYDNDILFAVPVDEIEDVSEGKHGLTKKTVISTKTGDKYNIQFDPHAKWFDTIKNRGAGSNVAPLVESAPDDGSSWYYEADGSRHGPVPSEKIRQFAQNNHTVYRFTKVWKEGMSEWRPADQTELSRFFAGPPPLTGDSVNNTIVWVLAFAPIIGVNIEAFFAAFLHARPSALFLITIGLNVILSLLDERKLNASGHNTRALGLGQAWLVPVYLYKRAKALNQSLAYFIVWLITFALTLIF